MTAVFSILFVQTLLGGFDNLWHHEWAARLPGKASARKELALHAAREAIYGMLYIGLAWFAWQGAWVLLPAGLLLAELGITCADFLEEDRSRRLPPLERVLHTVLAVSYGLLLGVVAPVFLAWSQQPSTVVPVSHGVASWFFTAAGVGVIAWSVRNAVACLRLRDQDVPLPPMPASGPAVLVTGATGFIGSALVRQLAGEGRRVLVYTRDVLQARRTYGAAVWAIDRLDDIPPETRIDAIVHLAGAPVLGLPWTRARRRLLIESRTGTMEQLLALMRRLHERPRVLVAASAVGFYGVPAQGSPVTERDGAQPGRFQSDLCLAAEHEALRAQALGVRVVCARFGIVLGMQGGAFPGLALPASLGLGARIGDGRQPMPWVHLQDAVRLLCFAMRAEHLHGPVNCVAPQAVDQATFTRVLSQAHGRGMRLRVPARLLHLALGEMAELLTRGQEVVPMLALRAGFRFEWPTLEGAVGDLLARHPCGSRDSRSATVVDLPSPPRRRGPLASAFSSTRQRARVPRCAERKPGVPAFAGMTASGNDGWRE